MVLKFIRRREGSGELQSSAFIFRKGQRSGEEGMLEDIVPERRCRCPIMRPAKVYMTTSCEI